MAAGEATTRAKDPDGTFGEGGIGPGFQPIAELRGPGRPSVTSFSMLGDAGAGRVAPIRLPALDRARLTPLWRGK